MKAKRLFTEMVGAATIATGAGAYGATAEGYTEARWPFVRVEEIRDLVKARQDRDRAISSQLAETVRASGPVMPTPSANGAPMNALQAMDLVRNAQRSGYVDAVTRADQEKNNSKRVELPFEETDGLQIVGSVGIPGRRGPQGSYTTASTLTINGRQGIVNVVSRENPNYNLAVPLSVAIEKLLRVPAPQVSANGFVGGLIRDGQVSGRVTKPANAVVPDGCQEDPMTKKLECDNAPAGKGR